MSKIIIENELSFGKNFSIEMSDCNTSNLKAHCKIEHQGGDASSLEISFMGDMVSEVEDGFRIAGSCEISDLKEFFRSIANSLK